MNLIPSDSAPDVLAGLLTIRTKVAAELLASAGLKPIHDETFTYLKREDLDALADRILLGVANALRATGGAR